MAKILITGGRNGLGKAIANALLAADHEVHCYDIEDDSDVLEPNLYGLKELDILINCAGVNKIAWLEDITDKDWDSVMGVNAKGIFKMSQHCLPMLKESKGTILNIVSNASHMPMTCSLVYNASKGAADIMTRQLARELTKAHDITVFGISPNKLSGTEMSKAIDESVPEIRGWSAEYAEERQKAGLLLGEETPPELVAEFIAYLLQDKQHHRFLSGTIIPYGA